MFPINSGSTTEGICRAYTHDRSCGESRVREVGRIVRTNVRPARSTSEGRIFPLYLILHPERRKNVAQAATKRGIFRPDCSHSERTYLEGCAGASELQSTC